MKRVTDELAHDTFDLAILGGGITGAGVALDASLRGLRVALIDKGDFASGTSSVSSKLVHGGLRYLEQLRFSLVHEALVERRRLLTNAPHLVWPLRFLLPFYQKARVHPWKWRLGLTLYDLLAGGRNIRRNRPLGRAVILRENSGLAPDGLLGGAEYHDAQMDDARLCLEVIRTAARQGAVVANYIEAVGFEMPHGVISGVRAVDRLSAREVLIRARQVLNATGPWVDGICRLAGDTGDPHLEVSKGVHIVVPSQHVPAAFLLLHPQDGRVFFVLPWFGKTLIGTTDTFDTQGPDQLTVRSAEVDYLLAGFNRYFTRPLSSGDVVSHFAGLRPLLRDGPRDASARSREFRIFHSKSGLISVAGGKYTTYRGMAEQITDQLARRLGNHTPCHTRDYRLDGAPDTPWLEFLVAETSGLRGRHGLSEAAAAHLVRRYGCRAAQVAAYIQGPQDLQPLVADEPDMAFEFAYQREHEMAVKPEDFLLRRTRLGLLRPEVLKNPPAGVK